MTTTLKPTHQLLSIEKLSILNKRNNRSGIFQFLGHLIIMGTSGYLGAINRQALSFTLYLHLLGK